MTTTREVGVDLQESGEDVRRMVSAIEKDNPGMRVQHLPGLIKVFSPGKLVIKRETIEDELGRAAVIHIDARNRRVDTAERVGAARVCRLISGEPERHALKSGL